MVGETLKEIAMLSVLAEAGFDPAQTEEVRTVARPMIEASRAEPGCGGYDYAFDLLEPDLMRVRELWRDEQALKDPFPRHTWRRSSRGCASCGPRASQ